MDKETKILLIGSEGYIGSYLKFMLSNYYHIETVDNKLFDTPSWGDLDYRFLTRNYINKFDVVILLAGYSSVKSCETDFNSVIQNNVANFADLLSKINKQKFIYASSGSVLSGLKEGEFKADNYYDLSKYQIDQIAQLSGKNYYGLRFGTVNGWSPNLRIDLMLNSMVYNALNKGSIDLYGANTKRPILAINDLCEAIEAIIDSPDNPGIYDLASFNTTPLEAATEVAKQTGVKVNVIETTNSPYDFEIDCTKFTEAFNFVPSYSLKAVVWELVKAKYIDSLGNNLTKYIKRDKIVKYECF